MFIYKFIKKNSNLDFNEESIVLFGVEMFKTLIFAVIISIVVAMIMQMMFEAIIFLSILIPIRQFAGGYHTKHKWTCAIMSLVIYFGSLYFIKEIDMNIIIQVCMIFIDVIIIFLFAPVDNINNKLDDVEIKKYNESTRKLLIFNIVIFMFLILYGLNYWSEIIVIALNVVSILLVLGYIKKNWVDRINEL